MEYHAPVSRNAHGIAGIGEIRQLEIDVRDAVAVTAAGRIALDTVHGAVAPAVIHREREGGPVEIGADGEPKIFDKAEEPIAMIIGIDGSEVVRASSVVEVVARGLGGRGSCRQFEIRNLDEVPGQRLVGTWCRCRQPCSVTLLRNGFSVAVVAAGELVALPVAVMGSRWKT